MSTPTQNPLTGKASGKPTELLSPTGKTTVYPRSLIDEVFEELEKKDLVVEKFRAISCKRIYEVGVDKVIKLAARAMTKNSPQAYFVTALKAEHERLIQN